MRSSSPPSVSTSRCHIRLQYRCRIVVQTLNNRRTRPEEATQSTKVRSKPSQTPQQLPGTIQEPPSREHLSPRRPDLYRTLWTCFILTGVCLEPSITPTVRPSTYRRDNTSAGRRKHWHGAVPRRFIPNVQGPPSDADPPANASRTPVKPTLWFEFTLTRFAARCLRGGRPSFRYRPTLQNHAASGPGPTSRDFP